VQFVAAEIFAACYRVHLAQWVKFNERIGIKDLNRPFKFRTVRDLLNGYGRYGIWPDRSLDTPSLSYIYIFEKPFEDTFDGDKLVRDTPEEFIAELTQLFILFPEALKRFDPVVYDLLSAMLGNTNTKKRDLLLHELKQQSALPMSDSELRLERYLWADKSL
jgi:hypothetical protein